LNIEAFCYLGLLRFAEQLEPSLALLPDSERAEATSLLASIKDLPKTDLLQRWSKLRSDEYAAISRDAQQQSGVRLEDLPPAVREWWVAWLERQNG
jgi:hypothetical protein